MLGESLERRNKQTSAYSYCKESVKSATGALEGFVQAQAFSTQIARSQREVGKEEKEEEAEEIQFRSTIKAIERVDFLCCFPILSRIQLGGR